MMLESQSAAHPAPPPGAPVPSPRKMVINRNAQRTNDEMRQHIAKLKTELDAERSKCRQLHRDKVSELKQVQEACKDEKERAIACAQNKWQQDKASELQRLRDSLHKEHDLEVRQMLKEREEDMRELKFQLIQENQESLKAALELQRQSMGDGRGDGPLSRPGSANSSSLVVKLQREIVALRESKRKGEERLSEALASEVELKERFEKCRAELNGSVDQMTFARELQDELKKADVALEAKLKEIARQSSLVHQLQNDKEALQKRIASMTDVDKECAELSLGSREGTFTIEDVPCKEEVVTVCEKSAVSRADSGFENDVRSDSSHSGRRSSEEHEKERQLQKKVTDLTNQVHRLEKKVNLLKQENETLKKKSEELKLSDEKIKKLKKRNAELAAIARRLEWKAKQLQQESSKHAKSVSPNTQDADHLKKALARQKAKDLAEHAKTILAKDREIEALQVKCNDLTRQLASGKHSNLHNTEAISDLQEMENIIKQAAKEKIRLERQIASQPGTNTEVRNKIAHLEESNQELKLELDRLKEKAALAEGLGNDLAQKAADCEQIQSHANQTQAKCELLEKECKTEAAKSARLTAENAELQRHLEQLKNVDAECEHLRVNLSTIRCQYEQSQIEAGSLHSRLAALQHQLQELEEVESERNLLQNEHQKVLEQLHAKQRTVEMLAQAKQQAEAEHEGALGGLQAKLRELERKYELQAVKHEELTHEMSQLRRAADPCHPRTLPSISSVEALPSGGGPLSENANANNLAAEPDDLISFASPRDDIIALNQFQPIQEHDNAPSNDFCDDLDEDEMMREQYVDLLHKLESLPHVDEDSLLDSLSAEQLEILARISNAESKRNNDDDDEYASKKTPFQVFVAKYSYDPNQFSPNESPDSELTLNAGDYIFVYGAMDEDGFFEGELMDGSHGLVPSNFVERVPEEELEQFHASFVLNQKEESSHSEEGPHADILELHSGDEIDKEDEASALSSSLHKLQVLEMDFEEEMADLQDDRFASAEVLDVTSEVPFPTNLQVDRQLTKSVVISWEHPPEASNAKIQEYHVFLDNEMKLTITAKERTKALIENCDSSKPHRISVRAVTSEGHSKDPQCTILFGKDVSMAPSGLRVSGVTGNNALVAWMPSHSTLQHAITVNGADTRWVSPGVYKFALSGLEPATDYTVTVRAHNPLLPSQKQHSTSVHFKTNLEVKPDPPLDVQVEVGPKEGTLLVTWLPVTLRPSGSSNGAPVGGYNIYVDGRLVAEVTGANDDHYILDTRDLNHLPDPQCLFLRTIATTALQSPDSNLAPLAVGQLQQEIANSRKVAMAAAAAGAAAAEVAAGKSKAKMEESKAKSTLTTTNSGQAKAAVKKNSDDAADAQEMALHSPPELSDIAEVDEDDELNKIQDHSPGHLRLRHAGNVAHVAPSPTAQLQNAPREGRKSPRAGIVHPTIIDRSSADAKRFSPSHIGFQPIREDGGVPSGAKLAYNNIPVPQIEITKDSSGSGPDNFSEDEEDGCSSTSGLVSSQQSPITPEPPRQVNGQSKKLLTNRHEPREKRRNSAESRKEKEAKLSKAPRTPTDDKQRKRFSPKSNSEYQELVDNNAIVPHKIRDDIPDSELIDYEDDGGESLIESVEMEYDDHRVRIFIALFDYDPTIMSPNPDALDEELPFKEGQLIKIYGDKDPDGFYLGEACGHRGLVPCNMVSEVQVDDPDIAAQLLRESNRTSASSRATSDGVRSASRTPATSSRGPTPRTPRTGSSRVSPSDPHDPSPSLLKRLRGTSKRVVAVYDYDPVTLSPNVDAELELSFRAGQKLVVYGEMDDDGFYYGELDGQRGLVPSNFLEEIREPPAAAQPRRESPRHRASSGSHRSSGGSTSQQRSVSRGEGEARHNGKDGRGSSSNPRERVKSSSDSRGGPREGSAGSHRSEHRSSSSHADKERKPSRQSPHKTAVAPSTERPQDQVRKKGERPSGANSSSGRQRRA